MQIDEATLFKIECIQKIRNLRAGGFYSWLNYLVQHKKFNGNKQEAIIALMERFVVSEKEVSEEIDYLFSLDIGMDELIRD